MPELVESMIRYIGQTVTIYTTSGGLSGCGFTGTLAAVCGGTVRLITDIGAAPACPIGSTCRGCCDLECCGHGGCGYGYGGYGGYGYGGYGYGGYGYGGYGYGGYGYGGYGNSPQFDCYNRCCNNWLGSITEIPIDRIASFTHNAI